MVDERQLSEFRDWMQKQDDETVARFINAPNSSGFHTPWFVHVKNTHEMGHLIALAERESSRRKSRSLSVRYWITTGIAVAALVVGIVALVING